MSTTKEMIPAESLRADEVKRVDPVKSTGFYMVDLQFGSKRSWRNYSGMPRSASKRPGPEGGWEFTHQPKVHRNVGPLTGSVVNGLISSHNDWIKLHRQQKPGGQVDLQRLVLNIEETEQVPAGIGSVNGMIPISMVERIVNSAIEAKLGLNPAGKG